MGGKRKELKIKNKKKKKANAKSPKETERERERVTYMRQNVSTTVWGTWWCGTSTKFLTFQFFYCYIQLSPKCARMKIRKFFLLFVEIIVKIRMCSFLIC